MSEKAIDELSNFSTEKTNMRPVVLKEEENHLTIAISNIIEEKIMSMMDHMKEIVPAILKSAVLEEYKQIQTDQQTKECEYANVLAILKERGEEPINSAWLLVLVNDMIQIHNAIRRLDLAVKKSGLKL